MRRKRNFPSSYHSCRKKLIIRRMPSCGSCNRYKSTMDLENFRKQLQKIPDRLKRDVCTYNIALRYGMVQENREPIKFYFEKVGGVDGN